MAIEVKVPALGESVVEATVGRWRKAEGDAVKVGEILVDLETDKVNLEVAADAAGVLESITRREGETVQIGDVLAHIGEGAGQAAAAPAPAPATEQPKPAPQPAATGGGYGGPAQPANGPAQPAPSTPAEDIKATPVARRVAAEHGVDLNAVPGSGPGGRTSKEDVLRYVEQQARPAPAPSAQPALAPAPTAPSPPSATLQSPVAPSPDREERIRMTRRRQTIAQRLVEAKQTTAMLTTFNEIDMSAVMELRKKRRESFQQRHGVRLGFMSFFIKAAIGALKAFPLLNAEIQGQEIVLKKHYDIGIAVGAEGGLVVPVLRDADRLSFPELERRVEDFGKRAQAGTLSIEDLQGGTFTITNGGVFGSLLSTPILNPPQVGILGMHKIEERPIALNGEVVIRPMMYVALSYDHRIVDGREAVQFLVRIKELIEDPETLLLEG